MGRLTQRFGLTRYEADEHVRMALEAYKKNRLSEAIQHMTEAIALLPTKAEYYATRGFFFVEDGIKDQALADLEKALKLNRYEMLAHYGRGMIAYQDKNWAEAAAHFTDAYYCDPKRPETLYYLALALHQQGDNASALAWMQRALAAFADSDRRKADAGRWVKELQKLLTPR